MDDTDFKNKQRQLRGVGRDAGWVEKLISPLGGHCDAFGRNDKIWSGAVG
jgi:hypothetical protein